MNLFLKRLMDLVLSTLVLIVTSPILVLIGVLIKLDSKGPIFFKQGRLKKNGKVFKIYKFRTMIVNAEKMGAGLFNYENDPRVTKMGSFLRKSSLDELPQLWNIFKGDMSIVGPRPPVSYELGEYSNLNKKYKKRFTMQPGITGLAQVSGRNENDWEEKVTLDNEYIAKFSKFGILLDIKIILITALKVFKMSDTLEILDEELEGLSREEIVRINNKIIIENATRKDDEDERN